MGPLVAELLKPAVGAGAFKVSYHVGEKAMEASDPDWTQVRPGEFTGNRLD